MTWQQGFFESSLEAFVVIDLEGVVKYWSPAATKLFAWTPSEATGRRLANLIIAKNDHDAHWTGMHNFRVTGNGPIINTRVKLVGQSKTGAPVPIELLVTPIDQNGERSFVGQMRALEEEIPQVEKSDEIVSDLTDDSLEVVISTTLGRICQEFHWQLANGFMVDVDGHRLVLMGSWQSESDIPERPQRSSYELGQQTVGKAWENHVAQWRSDSNGTFQTDLAVPLLLEGEVVVVLQFLDTAARECDQTVVDRVTALARDLLHTLQKQRWQQERIFLAEIVESTSDAVIGKDRQGRITIWNHGAEQVYGYTEQEVAGKSISIILPDGVDEEEQVIREVVNSGKRLASFETVRKHKSGRLIDISLTISPIRDPNGNLIGSATIERDISQQKQSLRDMRDREEKLRLLMEASGEAIYGIDTTGHCTFANRACAQVLGFQDPESLLDQDMHELIHHSHEDCSSYLVSDCPIHQTITSGISTHIANEVLWRADGTCFPAEYWASPIRRGNEIVGAVVVFEDATNRLQADRTRAELAAIVESSHDAIIGTEIDGTIKSWNQAATALYGFTASEAIGKQYAELLTAKADTVGSGECLRQHKQGHMIDVGVTESPIRDSQGKIIGTAYIERDITHRKQRENDLELARRDAEVANQVKSEFLANISHELRTPMNGVLGMLRIALREDLPKGLRSYLTTSRESAETLLLLLDDLLDLSRLEAGQFELEAEPFEVRDKINKAVKTLALRAHEKGLELSVHVDSNVPDWLEGDGMRIRQVITNLVGNAIKFTDQGDIVIEVSAYRAPDNRYRLECLVKDTGIGISEEAQDRIFEPFMQVDSSTTRTRSGSGLGLAICKELIERMGGQITVQSDLGRGTAFRFNVLLDETSVPERCPDVRQLYEQKAFVVDDNGNNREVLRHILSDFSMHVRSAQDAKEALEVFHSSDAESDYAIMIVDSRMPGIDGITLIDNLRKNEIDIPVILMVSPGERLVVERQATQLQVSALLEKPVSRSDVFDALMTSLNGPQLTWEKFEEVSYTTTEPLYVLVAEDTPANQRVVEAILQKRGHRVDLAHNGQEVITKLTSTPYDVILMDVQMPVMDGLQATARIRDHDELSHIPIIAMTAHARREDRRQCLDAGMDAYLSKPLDAEKLIRLVEKYGSQKSRAMRRRKVTGAGDAGVLKTIVESRKVVDLQVALKRLGGDREILRELARAFLEDTPLLLNEILSEGRLFEEQVRAAHSLKGLASNFEATQLVKVAECIESMAKGSRSVPLELKDSVELETERVAQSLKQII